MDTILITPIYTAVIALVFVLLSVRTLLLRRKLRVAIGHGKHDTLARAARAHGNFAEYVPLAIILLYFVEISTDNNVLVHSLGVLLIAGRLAHAYGVSQVNENFRYRVFGMALTFTVFISASLRLIVAYVA